MSRDVHSQYCASNFAQDALCNCGGNLTGEIAALRAALAEARSHSADVSQRLAIAEVARDAYKQQRDEARTNHRHEMEMRGACLIVADAAAALLDNMETLDEPHPLDFAVRGIDVERLRAALDGRRPER